MVIHMTEAVKKIKLRRCSYSQEQIEAIAVATFKDAVVLEPGHIMKDGSIYTGKSPDTGKDMYVASKDAPLMMNFNDAVEYAKTLDMHGRKDWRVPTKAELNVLFENREKGALKGTFNLTDSNSSGWYWSATRYGGALAYAKCF